MSLPAAGYISDLARTEGQGKTALEDVLKGIKQIPGAGIAEQACVLVSDAITPASGASGIINVDTEGGAATDNLGIITQTNVDDGQLLILHNANSGRLVTVKNNVGGTGQISLKSSGDFVLADPDRHWLMVKRTGTSWKEIARFPSADLVPILTKTANYSVVPADRGQLFMVSGTWTLTMLSAATAGKGFEIMVKNTGNGIITINDGGSNYSLYPREIQRLISDGSAWQYLYPIPTHYPGDLKHSWRAAADPGWFLVNDTSIGSGSSGATGRANADTELLYTQIWNNIIDQWAPVTGGRGASAAADFAANKSMLLPKVLGRVLAAGGTGTVVASGGNAEVSITPTNTLTVPSNNTVWITGMPVVFTLTSGTVTGLTSGQTYWVIRDTTTTIKLASTLANAQNGTAISLTAKSSPVWTITHTFTARILGESIGEMAHAQSITELLAHTHTEDGASGPNGYSATVGGVGQFGTVNTGSRGGNAAMNIMQPTTHVNYMVKL